MLDRIRLNGNIAVLEAGDLERGKQRPLSLFGRGDDASDLQKDGQRAGRLLLVNVSNMVSTETAKVEVCKNVFAKTLQKSQLCNDSARSWV